MQFQDVKMMAAAVVGRVTSLGDKRVRLSSQTLPLPVTSKSSPLGMETAMPLAEVGGVSRGDICDIIEYSICAKQVLNPDALNLSVFLG